MVTSETTDVFPMDVNGAMAGTVMVAKRSSEMPSSVTTNAALLSLANTTALGLRPTLIEITTLFLSTVGDRETTETS